MSILTQGFVNKISPLLKGEYKRGRVEQSRRLSGGEESIHCTLEVKIYLKYPAGYWISQKQRSLKRTVRKEDLWDKLPAGWGAQVGRARIQLSGLRRMVPTAHVDQPGPGQACTLRKEQCEWLQRAPKCPEKCPKLGVGLPYILKEIWRLELQLTSVAATAAKAGGWSSLWWATLWASAPMVAAAKRGSVGANGVYFDIRSPAVSGKQCSPPASAGPMRTIAPLLMWSKQDWLLWSTSHPWSFLGILVT